MDLRLTQQELEDRYKQHRDANPARIHARDTLDNASISRIEHSTPGDKYSKTKLHTAEVLAEALGVPVGSLIASTVAQPQPPIHKPVVPPESPIEKTKNDATDKGLFVELPYIDLPLTTVQARASFIEMCGPQADYGPEETIRYVFPPRPTAEYMQNKSRVFEVNGDSMEPEIRSGEHVVADPVPENRWELLSNKIIVISYDNVLTIKRVKENELLTKRVLTLHPARPELAPLTVRRELIRCIFVVRESFERKTY